MPLEKPQACEGCSLFNISKGFSEPEGTGSTPLLLVGESLGYNEYLEGLPFRPNAQAGSILHRVIQRARINRNSLAFWNLIGCMPLDNKLDSWYEYSAINHCQVHFDKIIKKYNPKVILALGALPFKHLTGMEGYKLNISTVRGYVFRCSRYPDVLVVPSYHPSYIRRGNLNLMGVLMQDLVKAMYIAQGKLVEGKDYILDPLDNDDLALEYNINPSVEDALDFLQQVKENPEALMAYDIETEKSIGEEEDELEEYGQTITQIQFSINSNGGIAFPFTHPFISIIRDILQSNNPKAGHNIWDFDNPILSNSDIFIQGSRIDDTMWMQHHFQADIPIGLQYTASFYGFPFPWKHLSGSNLAFYGIADVTSVHYIMNELPKKMKQRGMWEGYDKYVYGLKGVLVDIQNRGLPINIETQQAFGKEIEEVDDKGKIIGGRKLEILKELKKHIPDSFEKLNKVEGYKRIPKEVHIAELKYKMSKGSMNVEVPVDYVTQETGYVLRDFIIGGSYTQDELDLMKMGIIFTNKEGIVEKRWVKLVEFNPNSVDHISDLIKYNDHEELAKKLTVNIKRDYDNESKDNGFTKFENDAFKYNQPKNNLSTSKVLLKKLGEKTSDPAYKLIVEYKELGKMKGTYIDGYQKHMDNEGRVHTTYTFRPASGQLSSRNPNIQNFPMHSVLAEKFKECIEAKPGHLLVSLDYRGFHNKMMGFLALDPVYLRIASLDTHSFVTGFVVGDSRMDGCLELNDENLNKILSSIKKQYKKLRDDQIKHVVHGINFGLSEEGCYKRYLEEFNPSREEVLVGKHGIKDEEQIAKMIEAAGKKKVKGIYQIVKGLFPKIFEWQAKTIVEADKFGYLQTAFGARRWFFGASEIKYDKFGNVISVKKGEQAEQALAFSVSNSSHYHMRETMLLLEEARFNKEFRLINMIHDSLVFEPREDQIDSLIKYVVPIMERTSNVLKNMLMPQGFFCNVDGKIGKNMRDVEELKI